MRLSNGFVIDREKTFGELKFTAVYHFSIGTLLFVFVAVLLLLNIKQLMRTDWEHFGLFENGLTLSPCMK
jgi:hypothetical protein